MLQKIKRLFSQWFKPKPKAKIIPLDDYDIDFGGVLKIKF